MADRPRLSLRKTPVQRRARATAEAIVEAAAHILEAEGLAGFNTNAVAARAGASVGSLYQYFPGKEAILAALARREAERFAVALDATLARIAAAPLEDAPLDEALAAIAAVAVAHQSPRPRLARLLDGEEQRLGLGDEAQAATRGTAARLSAFLAARPDLEIADPDEAAADLLHLARGLIDGALERGAVTDLAGRVARAALGYLGAPAGC
jgi:AcrR family transcriptional regulator